MKFCEECWGKAGAWISDDGKAIVDKNTPVRCYHLIMPFAESEE